MKKLTQLFTLFLFIATSSWAQGPAGYTHIGDQWKDFNVTQLSHLAFGTNGKFIYKYFVPSGGYYASHDYFGGHPESGGTNLVYAISVTDAEQESAAPLRTAINAVMGHVNGSSTLSKTQLDIHAATIYAKAYTFPNDANAIIDAIAAVKYYEANNGPLFINPKTKGGFNRVSANDDGKADDRAVYNIMQALMSCVANNPGMVKHSNLLNGLKFETSKFFPGEATPPTNSAVKYSAKIDGTLNKQWGTPRGFQSEAKTGQMVQGDSWPARRATGCYLAPGSIGEVTVPSAIVNKGYTILVGAHTWSKFKKSRIQRLDNCWTRYPITSTTMKIANPLGGGVYIEVPYGASDGIQTVEISNVIKAPYYSNLPHRKTSDADWKNTERKHLGPWTDFESEKFMMSVPTNWIYNYDGAEAIMEKWDLAMEGQHELNAVPESKRNAVTLFVQVDLSIAHGAYGVGYPQVNQQFNPDHDANGNSGHWWLHDIFGWDVLYHEMGHMQMNPMFPGETESIVHVPLTYIRNVKFGQNIDYAFDHSRGTDAINNTRENTAISWMIRENFRDGKPMDRTNAETNEIRYQHKGHAKYAEVAALFGWKVITDVALEDNLDYMGTSPAIDMSSLQHQDKRIFQFSNAAGFDLTPLMHFWGMHPYDRIKLQKFTASHNLPPSKKICERLEYYKSIMAMDNSDFMDHFKTLYPNLQGGGNPNYAIGWYNAWRDKYNNAHGDSALVAMQDIIAMYFPQGCPSDYDCNNDFGGTASVDFCGVCAGGNTGNVPNTTCTTDCHGDPNGTAFIDGCNVCVEGNTGKSESVSGIPPGYVFLGNEGDTKTLPSKSDVIYGIPCKWLSLSGVSGSIAIKSGTFNGDPAPGYPKKAYYKPHNLADCNGVAGGSASIDSCGVCAGGNTGNVPNLSCKVDCNGDANGTAFLDSCNICVGGNTGKSKIVNGIPDGYVFLGNEGDIKTLPAKSNVVYGHGCGFAYVYAVSGSIVINNGVFGDPAPGQVKKAYYKLLDAATSINEQTTVSGLNIYPNPVHDQLNIVGEFSKWNLTDSKGAFIKAGTEKVIDVSALSPGVYYINVNGKVNKFIKI